jgi:hypothetical protein
MRKPANWLTPSPTIDYIHGATRVYGFRLVVQAYDAPGWLRRKTHSSSPSCALYSGEGVEDEGGK